MHIPLEPKSKQDIELFYHYRKIPSSVKPHPHLQAPTLLALITMDLRTNIQKLLLNARLCFRMLHQHECFISHEHCETALTSICRLKRWASDQLSCPWLSATQCSGRAWTKKWVLDSRHLWDGSWPAHIRLFKKYYRSMFKWNQCHLQILKPPE